MKIYVNRIRSVAFARNNFFSAKVKERFSMRISKAAQRHSGHIVHEDSMDKMLLLMKFKEGDGKNA